MQLNRFKHSEIAFLGAGGFAKEVAGLLKISGVKANCTTFVDFEPSNISATKQLSEWAGNSIGYCVMAVGSPNLKKKWSNELQSMNFDFNKRFGNIYGLTSLVLDPDNVEFGYGVIICDGVIITTDVKLGNFVMMNLNSTAGHGVEIGDYTTIGPGCHLNGDVKIGKCCDVGSGVTFVPGVVLADNGIIGAGSVVTKTLTLMDLKLMLVRKWTAESQKDKPEMCSSFYEPTIESYVMVGSPAKVIKINGIKVG